MTNMAPKAKHALAGRLAARLRVLVADNPLLLGVAAIGFSVSFQTIAREATAHHLPGWPVLYPLGIDVGILSLILEARKLVAIKRSDIVPRVLAWLLTGFTIYANVHGSPAHDWLGRGLHAVMPCLWVVFLELTRRRQLADERKASKADPIPLARWLFSPWRTLRLKRRMVLHDVTSYTLAVTLEDARLHALDLARAHYGRWQWRRDAPALLRARLRSGRLGDAVTVAAMKAVKEGSAGGWEDDVRETVTKAVTEGDKLTADVRRERRSIETAKAQPNDSQKTRQPAGHKPATDRAKARAKATAILTANPATPLADVARRSGVSERTAQRIKSGLPTRLSAVN
jgi:hypothetical protein